MTTYNEFLLKSLNRNDELKNALQQTDQKLIGSQITHASELRELKKLYKESQKERQNIKFDLIASEELN